MTEIGFMLVGYAIRQVTINSMAKETYRLAAKSAEKIANAEREAEQHEALCEAEFTKLQKRTVGIVEYLEGSFIDLFEPFENEYGDLRTTLLEDISNTDAAKNLLAIRAMHTSLCAKPEIQKMDTGNRISGSSMTTTFILFGNLGVKNRQLDAAKTQSRKADLIATHINTYCTALDLQRERYYRLYQTLGALNVALIASTKKAKDGMNSISWMLDENGHLPADVTSEEIKAQLTPETANQLAISVNIARIVYAILSEPPFDENAELTEKTQKLIEEGQNALDKIRTIEGRK